MYVGTYLRHVLFVYIYIGSNILWTLMQLYQKKKIITMKVIMTKPNKILYKLNI